MVRVSLSEPILISELRTMLASLLDAEVRERGNRLEIVFSASAELEPAAQVARGWPALGQSTYPPAPKPARPGE